MNASETDIRISLVETILKTFSIGGYKLAVEARYGFNYKRADVLVVENDTYAYEIKSDVDDLTKLEDQISDYRKNFDFVVVVTTDKFLQRVRKLVPRNVGLMRFSNSNLELIRAPLRNKRLSKHHMVHNCSKSELLSLLPYLNKSVKISEAMSQALKKLSVKELRDMQNVSFSRKFSDTTLYFSNEVSFPVRETDLLLLKRNSKISLGELSLVS